MARNHGAKEQKRAAKQKARRLAKRAALTQRTSKDPTIRLQDAVKWPIVRALLGGEIWNEGIGHALVARREPSGGLVYAVFLVDVFCLGVKNAFWRTGTSSEIDEVSRKSSISKICATLTPRVWRNSLRRRSNTPSSMASLPILTTGMPRSCSRGSIHRPAQPNSTLAATAGRSISRAPMNRPQKPLPSCEPSRLPEDIFSWRLLWTMMTRRMNSGAGLTHLSRSTT